MRRKKDILVLFVMITMLAAKTQLVQPGTNLNASFAIIIDQKSYNKVENAVLAYRDAVEKDGLSSYILIVDNVSPDEIRREIIQLKSNDAGLEGVVFIGDIPIPMIRDAQHLASAFKMDQVRFKFSRSSIPSDRFYDDFNLDFKFLEQDTSNTLLYYYSLTAASAQTVHSDIYSGRIKPPFKGEEKYRRIQDYLMKVVARKNAKERLDNMLRFNGHGYNSESLTAWENESIALREQFPNLYEPGGKIKSLYHEMSPELKSIIINNLQDENLDLALFHAHGGVETQYLLGYPPAANVSQNIDAVKMFLRSKIRTAKRRKRDVEEAKAYYMEQYGVPESWFEGAFDDSVIVADSIYSANLDMDISDVSKFRTGAELIIFDECFNGSFHQDRYIAGEYVFGDGDVIAGVANSVNVKQDIWTDEGLGLLNYNVRLGQWHREDGYLENHIIGDPTFRFHNPDEKDWSLLLQKNKDNLRFWKKTLKSEDVALRSLSVRKIVDLESKDAVPELVNIYNSDNSFIVRLSALKGLAEFRTPEFEKILFNSVDDPYELIRRFSVQWMGVVGREDYLPVLVQKVVHDPSDRVNYLAKGALEKIAPEKVYPLFEKEIQQLPESTANNEFLEWMKNSYERSTDRLRKEIIPELSTDTLALKKRIGAVRTLRNYQFQEALPVLISLVSDKNEATELRVVGLEALGWYAFSYNREKIVAACDQLLNRTETPPDVKDEALKTRKRIIAGYTDPVNP